MLNQQFLKAHPAHLIALGFGAGLSRLGAGTVGTLWAWASFLVLQLWLSPMEIGLLIGASTLIGWWACTVTAKHLGVADPGAIVWDEIVAFWLVLWLITPCGWLAQSRRSRIQVKPKVEHDIRVQHNRLGRGLRHLSAGLSRIEPARKSKRNIRHSIGPFHIGTRRDSLKRIRLGNLRSGVNIQAVQPA